MTHVFEFGTDFGYNDLSTRPWGNSIKNVVFHDCSIINVHVLTATKKLKKIMAAAGNLQRISNSLLQYPSEAGAQMQRNCDRAFYWIHGPQIRVGTSVPPPMHKSAYPVQLYRSARSLEQMQQALDAVTCAFFRPSTLA